MLTCLLCGFETELDDAAFLLASHRRVICLRCYLRATDHPLTPMPTPLRREVTAVLMTDVA